MQPLKTHGSMPMSSIADPAEAEAERETGLAPVFRISEKATQVIEISMAPLRVLSRSCNSGPRGLPRCTQNKRKTAMPALGSARGQIAVTAENLALSMSLQGSRIRDIFD
jgi:hypothetical protein